MADQPRPSDPTQPGATPAGATPIGSTRSASDGSTEVTGPTRQEAAVEPHQPTRKEESRPGFLAETVAPVAGFGVTFRTMFKKAETERYPEQKVPTMPRYHGRHQLNRHPDGLEKCIGCELCAWACPADAIYVEGAGNTPDAQFSPGERYGRVYQINYLRCIFCGLCIEACPTRALTMTNFYELSGPSRAGLIYEKQDLLAPMQSGMLAAPHPMVPGTDDSDYYRGDVTGPVAEQVEWVRQHRPQDESLQSLAERFPDGDDGLGADGSGARETAGATAALPQRRPATVGARSAGDRSAGDRDSAPQPGTGSTAWDGSES